MQMNKADKPLGARVIELILSVATVVVIFITIILFVELSSEISYHQKSAYGEATYEYSLSDDDYARISNFTKGAEFYSIQPKGVEKYFGIGRYYYAKAMTEISEVMEDDGMVSYWEEKRKAAESECGELSEYVSRIDRQLDR